MKESELRDVVRKLGKYITDAPFKLPTNKISEQWTRRYLIDPLLKALGWDDPFEVIPSDSSVNNDWIDYTLRPLPPNASSLCVEAKQLLSKIPQNRADEEIKKGLEQTEARGSDYFIWTNGDIWQLFAMKLPNAPIYEISISQACRDDNKILQVSEKLRLLSRETTINSPQAIIEQIRAYWKETVFPQALKALSEELAEETIKLMRTVLPPELDISNEEILQFLRECRSKEPDTKVTGSGGGIRTVFKPCDEEWEKLVASREDRYEKARKTLLENPHRIKMAEYLISNDYKPWQRTTTFLLLGLEKRGNDTKGVTGPAVGFYMKYGFIKPVDSKARPDEITYQRVDEAMPYLKRILQSK